MGNRSGRILFYLVTTAILVLSCLILAATGIAIASLSDQRADAFDGMSGMPWGLAVPLIGAVLAGVLLMGQDVRRFLGYVLVVYYGVQCVLVLFSVLWNFDLAGSLPSSIYSKVAFNFLLAALGGVLLLHRGVAAYVNQRGPGIVSMFRHRR